MKILMTCYISSESDIVQFSGRFSRFGRLPVLITLTLGLKSENSAISMGFRFSTLFCMKYFLIHLLSFKKAVNVCVGSMEQETIINNHHVTAQKLEKA